MKLGFTLQELVNMDMIENGFDPKRWDKIQEFWKYRVGDRIGGQPKPRARKRKVAVSCC